MVNFIKILVTSFIACIVFYGCSESDHQSQKAQVPGLDSTDYDIISAAITSFLFTPVTTNEKPNFYPNLDSSKIPMPTIILADSTKLDLPGPHILDYHLRQYQNDTQLTARLSTENRKKYLIDSNRISLEIRKRVISEANFRKNRDSSRKAFGEPPYWFLQIAKPSYSEDKESAFVCIAMIGWDTREGGLIWLRKNNRVWNAYDIIRY